MTINYTTLLGLAKPVTGTETGQWGDVVNDEITSLLEDAVANAATFSVTVGDVTLSTTNGASNQARMSTLIITGSPGILRNVIVPSQAKIYVVINQANAEVVIKGAATTGVTVGAGQTAQIAWNGSDFVEIGNYVHGNFVVNGNLSVNGNSTLGDGGADTTTINGQFIGANSNISKATTVSTSAPALAWVKGATYTDTASSGGTTQAHAPFTLLSAPTLATSNIVTYTNASTFYIAGAPSASGSATITNPYAMYVAAGEAYLAGAVTMAATTQNLALGTSQTSGTWTAGGAAQTGALTLDQSTKTHTLNLGTGATESAATKTVNIGTAGVSGSTTAVNIGSAVSGATNNVTINGNPTFNSGTANGVLYLNGSKVATSGSALTFDGNALTLGGATPRLLANMSGSPQSSRFGIQNSTTNGNTRFFLYPNGTGTISAINGTNNSNPDAADYQAFDLAVIGTTDVRLSSSATGAAAFLPLTFYTNGSEQMRLTSTGLGIGTSSPGSKLDIVGVTQWQASAGTVLGKLTYSGGEPVVLANTGLGLQFFTNNAFAAKIDSSGNLGIGTSSPVSKLHVAGDIQQDNANYLKGKLAAGTTTRLFGLNASNALYIGSIDADHTGGTLFVKNGATQMMLDSSGNLGLGVTPSGNYTLQTQINYASGFKGASIGGASIGSSSSGYPGVGYNVRFTNTGDAYNYNGTDTASLVTFKSGGFQFLTAPSGTAGNAISFTQAMTLDASGRLAIGATSSTNPVTVVGTANAAYTSAKGIVVDHTSSSTSVVVPIGFSWSSSISNQNPYWGIGFLPTNFGAGSGDLGFYTNGSERARITSGGDLGIGTSSPGSKLDVQGNALIGDGTDRTPNSNWNGQLNIRGNSYTGGISLNATGMWVGHNSTARDLIFATDETERARITSGGDLLVGKTSASDTVVGVSVSPTGAVAQTNAASTNATVVSAVYSTGAGAYRFYVGMAGTVYATNTTISAISDQRFKENIRDIDAGLSEIMALKPRKFDWKAGKGKDIKGDRGWIAQEFEQVFPDMIDTWRDPAPEGEEPYKAVRADLIPVLVKAIQEQQALITDLRARVAALEAA